MKAMQAHERIARNVKAFAALNGWSIESVLDAMEMSRQVWSKRTSGKSKFSADELERLAGVFDVTVNDLLSDPTGLLARLRAWVTAVEGQTPDLEAQAA